MDNLPDRVRAILKTRNYPEPFIEGVLQSITDEACAMNDQISDQMILDQFERKLLAKILKDADAATLLAATMYSNAEGEE